MPSLLHEALIRLVRDKPEFGADLLRQLLHVEVPHFTEARLDDTSLNEAVPVEYRADAVILFEDGSPVFGSVFEAQLREDSKKLFTWPAYAINARARNECPFVVIVVTPDSDTAIWASQTIQLGGGNTWRPFVVGPDGIPVITDVERARRQPELTVLSVMAHGKGEPHTALAIALAAEAAIAHFPEDLRVLYFAFIETALGDAARKAFEMHPQVEKFRSESQRRSFDEGRNEGSVATAAANVLDVLDARSLAVSHEQRERILACSDLAMLKTWVRRAATVATTDELFL